MPFLTLVTLSMLASAPVRELRVCADPNNLPFSNARGEGLENRIAQLLAQDLGASVKYTWWAQRRGFFRNTLKAGRCDVVIGVPVELPMTATTRPYYRSSYVFVTRADRQIEITSWDDPRLRTWKVGVQLLGDEAANSPPAHALSVRGIVDNVIGFSVYGDYSKEAPPADIVRAVEDGTVDVAIAWGPLAGYFGQRAHPPLHVSPVPADSISRLPMAFDIALGVRKSDGALRLELDTALERNRLAIQRLLNTYGVPR